MTPQVTAALVGAAASLFLALFGLFTARSAKARALAAEDAAKQTELVRTKALSAVEEVTFALGKLLEIVRTMTFMASSMSAEQLISSFDEPLHRFTDKFIDAYYRHLVYFDDELAAQFHVIRISLIHQSTAESKLKEQLEQMEGLLDSVTKLAQRRYLPGNLSKMIVTLEDRRPTSR